MVKYQKTLPQDLNSDVKNKMAKGKTKLGRGTYCFRDVGTKEKVCVKAGSATIAAQKVSKKLYNWEFLSFKKIKRKRRK